MDNEEVTLLNVYAPPGSNKSFFKKIFELIATESYGTLICGGDLNVQLQPKLDTTNSLKKKIPNATTVQQVLKELGMIDVWREFHPVGKQFTYYSSCHSMYSRIDYLFMYKSDMSSQTVI